MNISIEEAADLFRREPDRLIDVGTGKVAYRVVGNGPDVLFVHGWPVSGATFRRLLPNLADHVTCHVIDLVGSGSSEFSAQTPMSFENHIRSVRSVVDQLGLNSVAVVGHDSGGLISRHAMAGDPRLRALGLIDTEQSTGLSREFKSFITSGRTPGFGAVLGWLCGRPRLRRSRLVLGDAFADPSLLDGEFAEFFLKPMHDEKLRQFAAVTLLRSFEYRYVNELSDLHQRIAVPVQLVWGEKDAFFPVAWAKKMVDSFPDAQLAVITGAGLFSHEERPTEVSQALLPVLLGTANKRHSPM
jgi:pimeloyl-ACP methyl ester carboxylesterase